MTGGTRTNKTSQKLHVIYRTKWYYFGVIWVVQFLIYCNFILAAITFLRRADWQFKKNKMHAKASTDTMFTYA